MSRSRKKTPITGITSAQSEKQDKREANRKFRRKTKLEVGMRCKTISEMRELSNVWSFDKDGKLYDPEMSKKDLRK